MDLCETTKAEKKTGEKREKRRESHKGNSSSGGTRLHQPICRHSPIINIHRDIATTCSTSSRLQNLVKATKPVSAATMVPMTPRLKILSGKSGIPLCYHSSHPVSILCNKVSHSLVVVPVPSERLPVPWYLPRRVALQACDITH